MKLFRYGNKGEEKPGVLTGGLRYDVSALGEDYTNAFIASGGIERLQNFIEKDRDKLKVVPDTERLGVPLANPQKIVCVGLNYKDHAIETGFIQAAEPILFLKAISALNGPFDGVIIPKNSLQTDYETELGVVIGKAGTNIDETEADAHIAGYVLHNDISEREFMTMHGGTWDKGKGCNTFAPIGPYFVTKDEIPDTNNLKVWLKLNGELKQNGTTANFIYPVMPLVSYISNFFGLFPGDIISTGSPSGTGIGSHPQRFMQPGDVIEYGIDGLGEARLEFRAYSA